MIYVVVINSSDFLELFNISATLDLKTHNLLSLFPVSPHPRLSFTRLGDGFGPSLISLLFQGEQMPEILNHIPVNVACIGIFLWIIFLL
jgi:hypothetical protein